MKVKILLVAAFVSVLGAVFLVNHSEELPQQTTKQETILETPAEPATNARALQAVKNRIIAEIDKEIPAVHDQDLPTKEVLMVSFKRMHKAAGKFNSASFVRKEIEELLKEPEALEMASDILTSLDNAETLFGKDQALARVYAIKMLAINAEQGDTYPLYNTTAKLAHNLDVQMKNNQEFAKRQDLDLEELVAASLKTFDEKDINEVPETILQEIGYLDNQNEEIRRIYANKFGRIFAANTSMDEAVERVQDIFRKEV